MAITRYAGNRFDGLEADVKPVNVPDGAKWTDLDGLKRTYIFISGVWEEYIGGAIDPANSIEIDGDNLQLVGDVPSPGINKTYGTDGAGVRGYKDDPAGGEWGSITGILADQTDLQNALNDKLAIADKALKADAEAGTNDTKWMTPLKTKQAIDQFADAAGEANTASNVGGAVGLFLEKVGVDLRFRTIEAGDNITFDLSDPNKVVINGSAGGGGGGIDAITTESAGANTTITTTNSALHALTMTANLTATISDFNEASKTHRFVLKVIQDATGGRTLTIAGNVLFPAGIQPSNSESAGAVDLYEFVWDGTNWLLDNYTAAQA